MVQISNRDILVNANPGGAGFGGKIPLAISLPDLDAADVDVRGVGRDEIKMPVAVDIDQA